MKRIDPSGPRRNQTVRRRVPGPATVRRARQRPGTSRTPSRAQGTRHTPPRALPRGLTQAPARPRQIRRHALLRLVVSNPRLTVRVERRSPSLHLVKASELAAAGPSRTRVESPLWAISVGRVLAAATLATAGLLALAISLGRLLAAAVN